MKGMIWNSDGFGDTAKHGTVTETIREHNLSFVVILETGRSNFSVPFLKLLAGGRDLCGIVYLPMAALVAYWWVLMSMTLQCRIW